jgi:Flp pilus assembly protein TadG
MRQSAYLKQLRFPWLGRFRQEDSRRLQRARNECGSVIFETALSLIVLLTIAFGVMEMSLALYTYHFISEAAREGTRYAIVRGSSCSTYSGFTSACPALASDVQIYVRGLGFPGINPSLMTVTTAWSAYPAGSACTPSSTCNNPGNQVQVTVQYNFPLAIPFVSPSTLTMASSSTMVISD